jgi:hypothetical protein
MGAPRKMTLVRDQVEGRNIEFRPPEPYVKREVGAYSGGFAQR